MEVRRLRADEWQRWREFRLSMLREAPSAFGTTFAQASAYDDAEWQRRAATLATSDEQALFLAEDGEEWLASAGGFVEDDGVPNVFSVWTRPEARGRGAARAAIERVIAWAATTGATEVHLWATDTNEVAQRLYARLGFTRTGESQPLPSDESLTESKWALRL